jgi:hypothetical protein
MPNGAEQKGVVVPKQEIIDGTGKTVETREYATWADMCQPPPVKEVQLKNGKWVKYLPWITMDEMAEIQRKASKGRRRMDQALFMLLILQKIMIEPKVKTEQDRRAALKADSSIVLGVVNSVVDTETMDQLREELGES